MQGTFNTLRWAFIGLFALSIAGVWAYQIGWVAPRQKCESSGRWWSNQDRTCATPISISVFTGKPTPQEPLGRLVRGPAASVRRAAGSSKSSKDALRPDAIRSAAARRAGQGLERSVP